MSNIVLNYQKVHKFKFKNDSLDRIPTNKLELENQIESILKKLDQILMQLTENAYFADFMEEVNQNLDEIYEDNKHEENDVQKYQALNALNSVFIKIFEGIEIKLMKPLDKFSEFISNQPGNQDTKSNDFYLECIKLMKIMDKNIFIKFTFTKNLYLISRVFKNKFF